MSHFWRLFFIPHEKNNHRAFLLQPSFIALFIAIYLLNQSFIKSFTIIRPGVLGYSSEITVDKVLSLTNQERQKAGLPILHYNSVLSESATAKAKDMFLHNYWAHNSPQGLSPWDFFKQSGYSYSVAGENLAKDFYDTDSMVKAWMNSPTHRDNIISSKYEETGIAVVNGVIDGVKTTLVVQHFAMPLNGVVANDTTSTIQTVQAEGPALGAPASTSVLATSDRLISPLMISQFFGSTLFVFIIFLIIVDAIYTVRNKTHRLSGASAGHFGFLVIILMLLVLNRAGTIF